MIREFSLTAYDRSSNKALSEFKLPRVTGPSGFGFSQKVTVQETDAIDYVVKQVIQKKDIKLTVNFVTVDAYKEAENFQAWLGRYLSLSTYKMTLRYTNGINDRLVDVYIADYEIIAQDAGVVGVQLLIKPLTPNYQMGRTQINISASQYNKTYPYSYPYRYGGGSLTDNKIQNDFIAAIPLCVTLKGRIVNPQVSLTREGEVTPYAIIRFTGLTLADGARLVIDGINQRITYYANENAEGQDYFNVIDKDTDTFLMCLPGVSEINANLDAAEESHPCCEITYVQYLA